MLKMLRWGPIAILNRAFRVDLIKKVIFLQKFEGGKTLVMWLCRSR